MVNPRGRGRDISKGAGRTRQIADPKLVHSPNAGSATRGMAGVRVGQLLRRQAGYEDDFAAWAQAQAEILRRGLFHEADVANIVEELEGLSRSERRALRSCLTLIVCYMLKLMYQPAKASKSWAQTIHRERRNLERLLEDSPSLKAHLSKLFREAYEDGRHDAAKETGLELSSFPADPVISLDQLRDQDFLPTGDGDIIS